MIKIYENFLESDFLKRKQKKDKKVIQKLGEYYIQDIVKNGDFEGLKFLQNQGFSLKNCGTNVETLTTIALKNNQIKMLEYLLKSDYLIGTDYNPINSIYLPDIIYIGYEYEISNNAIEWLKIVTQYGYNFNFSINEIEEFLCSYQKYNLELKERKFIIKELEPFIDWLLEYYPHNYKLCKDVLPEHLLSKYKYLDDASKYNI